MFPVQWCNLCQSAPAVGLLSGHFQNLEDEPMDLFACKKCADEALKLKE